MKVDEILRPFEANTWNVLTIICVISGVVLVITLKLESTGQMPARVSDVFLIIIGAVCQQG